MLNPMIVLIIFMILLIVLYILNKSENNVEEFVSKIDYSRVYPGTFSYKYGYGPPFKPFYTAPIMNPPFNSYSGNVRYSPGYRDYWYIPAHMALNEWINGPTGLVMPDKCIVPPSVSESCVDTKITDVEIDSRRPLSKVDMAQIIMSCSKPASVSESCPNLTDWTGPLSYDENLKSNFAYINE